MNIVEYSMIQIKDTTTAAFLFFSELTQDTQLLQMTSHFKINDKQVVIMLLPCPVSYTTFVNRMIVDLIFV